MKNKVEISFQGERIPFSDEDMQKMQISFKKCQDKEDCIISVKVKKLPMILEDILKIVKQKHKKASIYCGDNIFWSDKLYDYSLQIDRWDHTKIDYECYSIDDCDYDSIFYKERFSIDNNIFEIKHLLGLPISKKDFMDWIEDEKIDKSLFKDLKVPEDNKYWRLYNIVRSML